jgi:hypothetical protein
MSISVGYAGTSILQGIQPESIECAQLADMGETATGAFTVEDDVAALTIIGYQPVTISESACSQPRLFTGWTFERGYQRDPENALLAGVARTHDVSIVDMNSCFGFRQITRTGTGGGNRPAETWAQRLTWILESEYLRDWISPSQDFVVTNTTAMDPADYRGSYPSAVLNDLSDRSGNAYDYFAFWDPTAKQVRLFFDNDVASIGDSVLRINTVLVEQDQITTFGPDKLAKLQRESDQVYSDVCVNYADGTLKLYRSRPSTYNTFVRRSTQIDRPYTRGVATATLQAEAFLDKHSVETDRVTCTIRVPASRVGLVQAGQRIQFKAPHMPGYGAYVWMRVVMCTPKPANEAATHYDVALELVYRPVAGGGGDCPCVEDSSGPAGLPEYSNSSHYDQAWGGDYYTILANPVVVGAGCERDISITVTFDVTHTNPGGINTTSAIEMTTAPYASDVPNHVTWAVNLLGELGVGAGTYTGDMKENIIGGGYTLHIGASAVDTLFYLATKACAQSGGTTTLTSVVVNEPNCTDDDEIIDLGPTPGATTEHTTDPTVTDDAAAGYTVGSVWVNTTAPGSAWILTDSTTGAAVWVSTTTTGAVYAPTTADYLVGTAQAGLSAEIVVGTTPGGELGGTWASPTVDATHSGSAHLALGSTSSTAAAGDHTHAATGTGELLITDTPAGSPLVFADILQNDAGTALLYSDT